MVKKAFMMKSKIVASNSAWWICQVFEPHVDDSDWLVMEPEAGFWARSAKLNVSSSRLLAQIFLVLCLPGTELVPVYPIQPQIQGPVIGTLAPYPSAASAWHGPNLLASRPVRRWGSLKEETSKPPESPNDAPTAASVRAMAAAVLVTVAAEAAVADFCGMDVRCMAQMQHYSVTSS